MSDDEQEPSTPHTPYQGLTIEVEQLRRASSPDPARR